MKPSALHVVAGSVELKLGGVRVVEVGLIPVALELPAILWR